MHLFETIAAHLSAGESLVLATLLERSGSAPRAVGSRMVVRSDGTILGTIGGGILEARIQGLAAEVFQTRKTVVRRFTLTAEDASHMGMICGGEVRILIQFVDASAAGHPQFYRETAGMLKAYRRGWLLTRLSRDGETPERVDHALLGADGSFGGTLDCALARSVVSRFTGRQPEMIRHGEEGFLVEPLNREGRVFIFGAGHISRELAPLARLAGFRTIVLDDREEFANRDRFPTSDEIRVLETFEQALVGLLIDDESYLVLVTRGHAHDKAVLAQALRTQAAYIGMIGSRRKRDAIYQKLLEEGCTPSDLDRVHSPIGLDIGAETPAEIAISIVAELIQVRAGNDQ
jgi:xanthine dehydrogenase accessory factor